MNLKLCEKCVMRVAEHETLCEDCKTFVPINLDWEKKEMELREVLKDYKGKGKKYDVIVPLTGGKDSSYVLYYLTKVLDCRVLAFTWDNLLIREQSWENIRNAIRATGADHQVFKWKDEKMLKLHRSLFKEYASICFCPVYMGLSIFAAAMEQDVPLIVTGFSEGQRELDHTWSVPGQIEQKNRLSDFFTIWREFFAVALTKHEPDLCMEILNYITGKLAPYVSMDDHVNISPILLPLSNFVNWSSMIDLEETLGKHLGWKKPTATYMHTSCIIEPIRGYIEYRKNLNEMSNEMSNMIRSGDVKREDCLKEMTLMGMDGTLPDLSHHNNFLGITEEEFFQSLERNIEPHPWLLENIDRINSSLAWIKSQIGISKCDRRNGMNIQDMKYRNILTQGMSAMLFLLFAMFFSDYVEFGMMADFSGLEKDPGIVGLWFLTAIICVNIIMQITVRIFDSKVFKWSIFILLGIYTLLFVMRQFGHHLDDGVVDFHFFFDLLHHAIGIFSMVTAFKWAKLELFEAQISKSASRIERP